MTAYALIASFRDILALIGFITVIRLTIRGTTKFNALRAPWKTRRS